MINTNKQTDIPRQEIYNTQGRRELSVLPLGFEATDVERLKRIFQLEPERERLYIIPPPASKNPIDIVLVNHDNPSASGEKQAVLANNPAAQVVVASRGPIVHPPQYHIRGMLIAVRVLSVLDKIPARLSRFVPDSGHPPANRQTFAESRQERPKIQIPFPADAAHPAINLAGSKSANGYRALVVDDSAAIQKSLELKLAALDEIIAVDLADSGESALEKAETVQYDLIFLDVVMPGIDGYETCTRLRKKADYKKTPIIMVSGKTSPLDEVKGVIAGCTTYLTKPVQDDAFHKLSCRILAWLATYQRAEKLSH